MTVRILVDLRTIKKNPDAGRTRFVVEGKRSFHGKYKGKELPKDMAEFCHVVGQDINYVDGGAEFVTIFCDKGIPNMDVLQKHSGAIEGMTFTHTPIEVTHLPQPEYLFDYEKTKLKCSNCGSKVRHDHIESDYIYDGEDEVYTESCPICHASGTFPYRKYESIGDALNRMRAHRKTKTEE